MFNMKNQLTQNDIVVQTFYYAVYTIFFLLTQNKNCLTQKTNHVQFSVECLLQVAVEFIYLFI